MSFAHKTLHLKDEQMCVLNSASGRRHKQSCPRHTGRSDLDGETSELFYQTAVLTTLPTQSNKMPGGDMDGPHYSV